MSHRLLIAADYSQQTLLKLAVRGLSPRIDPMRVSSQRVLGRTVYFGRGLGRYDLVRQHRGVDLDWIEIQIGNVVLASDVTEEAPQERTSVLGGDEAVAARAHGARGKEANGEFVTRGMWLHPVYTGAALASSSEHPRLAAGEGLPGLLSLRSINPQSHLSGEGAMTAQSTNASSGVLVRALS